MSGSEGNRGLSGLAEKGTSSPSLNPRPLHPLAAAVMALALCILSGCTTTRYLAQAGCGQVDLIVRARDIQETLADSTVPARTRDLLARVPGIKQFGEKNSLRPTKNYRKYVALDRRAVVWVVTASEPLRFKSKTWWFPIVGHVPYLGWFDRGDAIEFADDLREEGWDVDVGGADAYSTLGWFDDPVLSTMIPDGPVAVGDLANVVLHESVHATLYIDGQTRFNESLAEFTARRLTMTYLEENFGPGSAEQMALLEAEQQSAQRAKRLNRAYNELAQLYASDKPKDMKLAEKKRVLVALRDELRFRRPITNATLAAFKTYNSGVPEFAGLFEACGGSYKRFLGTLAKLKAKGSFSQSNQSDLGSVLAPLVHAGCPQ